jgi:hypothetical protein
MHRAHAQQRFGCVLATMLGTMSGGLRRMRALKNARGCAQRPSKNARGSKKAKRTGGYEKMEVWQKNKTKQTPRRIGRAVFGTLGFISVACVAVFNK